MRPKLLEHVWRHTLPGLGLDARGQQAIRRLVHRALFKQEPFEHVLAQIHGIMNRSRRRLGEPPGGRTTRGTVIVWTMRGGPQVNVTEAIIAYALRLRGVDVRIVLCDMFLPACEQRAIQLYPHGRINPKTDAQICDRCYLNATQVFEAFDLPVVTLSSVVTAQEVANIHDRTARMSKDEALVLEEDDIYLGGEIRASINQFYRALTWPDTPQTLHVLQRTAAGALMVRLAAERVLAQEQPQAVLTSHGVYLLWGISKQVAQRRGVPVIVWGNGVRVSTLRFSRGNWFEDAIAEPPAVWEGLPLTPERAERLDDYLGHRWDGRRDRRVLFGTSDIPASRLWEQFGLDPARPTLGVFPNVAWDADVTLKDVAFLDMNDWLLETVRFFVRTPQYQAIIRVHPGETVARTNEHTDELIRRNFPALPPNVVVIPGENKVSSYALINMLRAATVYGTQFGLELACSGIPVIVAARSFYGGKGLTLDVATRDDYLALLHRFDTVKPLEEEQIQRARRYAYHYYFRRHTPFPYLVNEGWADLKDITLHDLGQLLPGRDPHLDQIIAGILENKPILTDV